MRDGKDRGAGWERVAKAARVYAEIDSGPEADAEFLRAREEFQAAVVEWMKGPSGKRGKR
ncbi:MAG: hypothetical protein WB493_00420 [Anaeromyxobacteraceae bacterium]